MPKSKPMNLTVILACAGGGIALFTFIYQSVAADVGQKRDISETQEDVAEIAVTVKEHSEEIEQVDRQYDMIQQDMGYLKGQQQEILNAIKQKR